MQQSYKRWYIQVTYHKTHEKWRLKQQRKRRNRNESFVASYEGYGPRNSRTRRLSTLIQTITHSQRKQNINAREITIYQRWFPKKAREIDLVRVAQIFTHLTKRLSFSKLPIIFHFVYHLVHLYVHFHSNLIVILHPSLHRWDEIHWISYIRWLIDRSFDHVYDVFLVRVVFLIVPKAGCLLSNYPLNHYPRCKHIYHPFLLYPSQYRLDQLSLLSSDRVLTRRASYNGVNSSHMAAENTLFTQ